MWNMQNSNLQPKQSKANIYWVSVYAPLRKAFQKVLYLWGLKESPLWIVDIIMITISNGLINLPFSFRNFGLGYEGRDFPGFDAFHTRRLPTFPKHRLISPTTDTGGWAFPKLDEVVKEKFENFLRNLEEGISQVWGQLYLLFKINSHYNLISYVML